MMTTNKSPIMNFSIFVILSLQLVVISSLEDLNNLSRRSTTDQKISRDFGDRILDDEIIKLEASEDSTNNEKKIEKRSPSSSFSLASPSSSPPPPPPEIFKFELSDAKEPDEATKAFFRQIRQHMMLDTQKSEPNVTNVNHYPDTQSINHTSQPRRGIVEDDVVHDESDHDQGGHESQKIKIYVPLRQSIKRKPRKSTNFLPQEVQKVITAYLKDQSNQRQTKQQSLHRDQHTIYDKQQYQDNAVSSTISTPKNVYYYGDKIPNQSSSTVTPPLNIESSSKSYKNVYSKGAIQLFTPQQDPKHYQPQIQTQPQPLVEFHPVEVVKVIPQINYATVQNIQHQEFESIPYKHSNELDSSYPKLQYIQSIKDESGGDGGGVVVGDSTYLQKQEQQQEVGHHHLYHYPSNPSSEPKFLPTATQSPVDDSKYEALTALVGKNPVDQLQGLTYLLSSELLTHPNYHNRQQQLQYQNSNQNLVKSPSEDNRAPITFPSKSDSSYNQASADEHHYHQSNDVNDESKYNEYNAVNNNNYESGSSSSSRNEHVNGGGGGGVDSGFTPSSVYGYAHKEYTPVTESPEQNHLVHEIHPIPYHQHNHLQQQYPHHQHLHHDVIHNSIQPIESVANPSKIVHITTPASITETSYKTVHAVGLSPNYKGIIHDDNGLQYAARYAFGYRVRDFHTGNDFGHRQNRDIDGVTRGEYHILLPDGRVQNVRYLADDTGFHADVNFETGQ